MWHTPAKIWVKRHLDGFWFSRCMKTIIQPTQLLAVVTPRLYSLLSMSSSVVVMSSVAEENVELSLCLYLG